MAINDIWQLTMIQEQDGVAMSNRLFFKEEISPAAANAFDVWAAWLARSDAAWKAFTSDRQQIVCISTKVVAPIEGPAFSQFISIPGSVGGDALPTSCHTCFTMYASDAGPPISLVRNSMLKAGIVEAWCDDGNLNSTGATLADAFLDTLTQDATSGAGGTYVPHAVKNPSGPAPTYHEIVSAAYRNIIRSTRRRTTKLCAGS